MKIAVLGAGKMAGILLQALLREEVFTPEDVTATVKHGERAAELSHRLGCKVTVDNIAAAREADVILLGVKPWQITKVIGEIATVLTKDKVLISVAAGIGTSAMESAAGIDLAVVRAMPNTPSQLGAGATALCAGRFASAEQMELARRMFEAAGRVVIVDEDKMNAVTGVSGSGPAFFYLVIEALAAGGVEQGLSQEVATLLAAQTALGAARMVLETGYDPAQLVSMVTTPNGTTVAGIQALEEGGLRTTLIDAVKRTTVRAKELAG